MRGVWLLVSAAAAQTPAPRPTFELNNAKAFRSSDVEDIDDDYLTVLSKKRPTECYTGSQMYELTRVFCDQLCRRHESGREDVSRQSGRGPNSRADREFCNGPWYCSQMEICEAFHRSDPDSDDASGKNCMIVRSCANHSQCFPTSEDAANMNIIFENQTADNVREHGYRAFYGGMSFRTTCCSNRENYRPGIDSPCNSAASLHYASALAITFLASALLLASSSSRWSS